MEDSEVRSFKQEDSAIKSDLKVQVTKSNFKEIMTELTQIGLDTKWKTEVWMPAHTFPDVNNDLLP